MAFKDNKARSRFELEFEGGIAFADYRRREGIVDIRHMETPAELQGRGAATRLMDEIIGLARANHERVRPTCPFAAAYFSARPELKALRA